MRLEGGLSCFSRFILSINMTSEEILHRLQTKRFGKNIHLFETIDSTNIYAKSLVPKNVPEGTIVIAESQTHGRGRLGRIWHSNPGKNLTFSIILQPNLSSKYVGIVSLYAGLAVSNIIGRISHLQSECKWPNDILLEGKKVCGILSEASFPQGSPMTVIIGIGLNVNQTEFPPQLKRPATSLMISCGNEFNRIDTLCEILFELETLYPLLDDAHCNIIIERWSKQSLMLGKEIEIEQSGRLSRGIAKALAEDGQLIVETPDGPMKIFAGDTTLV